MELRSCNGIFKFYQVDIYIYIFIYLFIYLFISKSHSFVLIIVTRNWATVRS
jgi:hypothetical protein